MRVWQNVFIGTPPWAFLSAPLLTQPP